MAAGAGQPRRAPGALLEAVVVPLTEETALLTRVGEATGSGVGVLMALLPETASAAGLAGVGTEPDAAALSWAAAAGWRGGAGVDSAGCGVGIVSNGGFGAAVAG